VLLVILLGLGLMGGLYLGTGKVITFIIENIPTNLVHPTTLLSSLFSLTGAVLLVSNSVVALGVLFAAQDLELIRASPLSRSKFFLGRFADIFLTSSTASFAMTLPILYGFGYAYNADLYYFLLAPPVFILFLIIPVFLAASFVTAALALIPSSLIRDFFLIIGSLLLVAILLVARYVFLTTTSATSLSEIIVALQSLSLPYRNGSPPYWAATTLGTVLSPAQEGAYPSLCYLIFGAACSLCFAILSFYWGFDRALAAYQSSKGIQSQQWSMLLRRILDILPISKMMAALLFREITALLREPAQIFQIVLLGGLSSLYLYNFSFIAEMDALPEKIREWWQVSLILIHFGLTGFLLTAAANRFAFPAISMERHAIWIIAVSPVPLHIFIFTKFLAWSVILGTPTIIAVAWGTVLITHSYLHSAITATFALFQTIAIIGLSQGLGARFARFDWDHFTQLAASLGSIVFMVSSLCIIAVFIFPAAVIFSIVIAGYEDLLSTPLKGYGIAGGIFLLVGIVSISFTRSILRMGEQDLAKRLP
jgi:ABC-2 type transport system permease protein